MTKLITAFIIVVICYCAYHLFRYWESVSDEEQSQRKEVATLAHQAENLPGLPPHLQEGLRAAQQHGANGLRNWLNAFGSQVQDPRKAWLEMDLCVAIAREDPAEARRIFKSVKERIPPSSPVWPRVKQLEESFE